MDFQRFDLVTCWGDFFWRSVCPCECSQHACSQYRLSVETTVLKDRRRWIGAYRSIPAFTLRNTRPLHLTNRWHDRGVSFNQSQQRSCTQWFHRKLGSLVPHVGCFYQKISAALYIRHLYKKTNVYLNLNLLFSCQPLSRYQRNFSRNQKAFLHLRYTRKLYT